MLGHVGQRSRVNGRQSELAFCLRVVLGGAFMLCGVVFQIKAQHAELKFTRSVFVNNAGSLGPLRRVGDLDSLADIRAAVDLNVTSALFLTSAFTRLGLSLHGGDGGDGGDGGAVGTSACAACRLRASQ